jgi:hypothetical protein
MINVKNQVPNIYYDASRDFQILGHLYEVVLNYAKTNADMLYLLPNGIEADTRITELLTTTLGFTPRRNYDKDQLAALASIFSQILKCKGTKKAVDLAGNALVKAAGVQGAFSSEIENHVLTVKIPIELSDITLFLDLLPYILPFGIRVSIVRTTAVKQEISLPINAGVVMRRAVPRSSENLAAKVLTQPHPLGLAKLSDDASKLEYSSSRIITDTVNTGTGEFNAIAGLFGASPIIAFDPTEETGSSVINLETEEENT